MDDPASPPADRRLAYAYSRAIRNALPKPNRIMAPFTWYGGKGNLVKRILPYLPSGRIYVEPFAGAASVLFHKQPSPVEVLNDLNEDVVNVFRVLQSPEWFEELAHRLTWTPYSRAEFVRALQRPAATPVDRAWAAMVRFNFAISGIATTPGNWSRAMTGKRDMAEPASKWRSRLHYLDWWHDRLSRVQIDCIDAIRCITYWDSPDTVFYLDPPYVLTTRKNRRVYQHEYTDEQHRALVEALLRLQGQAVVSGYEHPIYRPLMDAGWRVVRIPTACHAACRHRKSQLRGRGTALAKVPRTEVLWISPAL